MTPPPQLARTACVKDCCSGRPRTSGDCCSSRAVGTRGPCRFEVPSSLARRDALGSNSGFPFMLQRVLRFAEVWFEPIPEPGPRDWLSLHPELMQTFDAFRTAFEANRERIGPSSERQCLHLLPLGPGEPEPNLFSQLKSICAAFFWPLRVAVLRVPSDAPVPRALDGEIDADEVLAWMAAGLRANSALTVAITEAPLRSGGNPTIGASDWVARVGVFSIAKYIPRSDMDRDGMVESRDDSPLTSAEHEDDDELKIVFERIAKLITHEAVHMLGVLHCCYYRCLMNGSSSLDEVDSKPPYLCGMCLKKLHLALGFDPLERYVKLASAWASADREDVSKWYSARVAIVQSTLASCRGKPLGALALQRSTTGTPQIAQASRPASSMSTASTGPVLRIAQRAAHRAAQRPATSMGCRSRPRSPSSRDTSPEPERLPVTLLTQQDLAEARTWPSSPLPPCLRRTCKELTAPVRRLQARHAKRNSEGDFSSETREECGERLKCTLVRTPR